MIKECFQICEILNPDTNHFEFNEVFCIKELLSQQQI